MKQKNVQKDNVNGTGNLVVEKIVESKKGGIFVLAMVLLFWCALLFALPAMAAEKTCAVSIPVSVKMTGNGSDSQTQKNPAFLDAEDVVLCSRFLNVVCIVIAMWCDILYHNFISLSFYSPKLVQPLFPYCVTAVLADILRSKS